MTTLRQGWNGKIILEKIMNNTTSIYDWFNQDMADEQGDRQLNGF